MARTVAQIAKRAFDRVAARIPDAIHAATLTREVQGAYDAVAGAYSTTTATQSGRIVVDTVKPIADIFPAYVVGPSDELILLEGFTSAVENDELQFAGRTKTVKKVQDIVAAGSLFYVVAT